MRALSLQETNVSSMFQTSVCLLVFLTSLVLAIFGHFVLILEFKANIVKLHICGLMVCFSVNHSLPLPVDFRA